MPEHRFETQPSTFTLHNALLAAFKHKWLIIICTLVGLITAAGVWFFYPVPYASQAKLLVRYVLERSAVDPVESANTGARRSPETVVSSEVEILRSWDLAMQVAEAIGVKRLLPESNGKATTEDAASTIASGLEVAAGHDSNIILVTYKNRHPDLAVAVLNELVNRYFVKHLEVHRSAGAFDFVSQQTDAVRSRLNQTEDALKNLKAKAGILSLADSTTTLSAEMVRVDDQLRTAEGELAEEQARVKQIEDSVGSPSSIGSATPAPNSNTPAASPAPSVTAPSRELSEYQAIVARLTQLRQAQMEMLSKYTTENVLVKVNRQQIEELENQKRNLEKKYPELATKGLPTSAGQMDLGSERARLIGVRAKVDDLRLRRSNLQDRFKQLTEMGPQIASLERSKEMEEANYKYFQGTLEKARVDEALDPSKMPNISAVQRPSPPIMVTRLRDKAALGLAGSGLALGLALALGMELILNRTFKSRSELELQLRTPVMVTIPDYAVNGRVRLPWKNGHQNGDSVRDNDQPSRAPWDPGHFIRRYSEAIRDRLGLYFELQGVTHKPKLVGVTSFEEGAGASTLAAGVAAALSETGDGKVLLVDVNAASGQVHPFFAGKPAASLTAAIKPSALITSAADNLYLATISRPNSNATQLGLKKFFALVPNLKASDFDYIIFDMPPLNQTSPTIGLAALMDKVLLVVEAEKSNREVVKRGYRELVGVRADVSVVLNKTRSYGPDWLESGS
jgi:succinoglycan biosynthesis transport protein ExoP